MELTRRQYLFSNTLIFAIGNFATKLINFFLIPLYTSVLNPIQYGTIDLITTITTIATPILTLNISEAVMRFNLDEKADKNSITKIGTIIFLIGAVLGLFLFPLCNLYKNINSYNIYIYLFVISIAASQLYLCDLRGKELIILYSIGNVIQTFIIALLNIIFLSFLDKGVEGYLLAYIISGFMTTLYAIVAGKGYKSFCIFSLDISKLKSMLTYSIVLIPNTFMWWIMNSSDHVMITNMIGISANGIYAISYKLPTLISTITTIFNQAWTYSAIKEHGSDDEIEFYNIIFKKLICFSMIIGILMLSVIKLFLKIYVTSEYYSAWKYTPFLIIGCVYLTLASFMATSYTIYKDSFGYLFSSTLGAILNIILNFILIPLVDIYGAAIATCFSYIIVFIFRLFHTHKYISYKIINKEFIVGSFILICSAILIFFNNVVIQLLQFILSIYAIFYYRYFWMEYIKLVLGILKRYKK